MVKLHSVKMAVGTTLTKTKPFWSPSGRVIFHVIHFLIMVHYLYTCLLLLKISQMYEILYKICIRVYPDSHERTVASTNCSIVLLHSYN